MHLALLHILHIAALYRECSGKLCQCQVGDAKTKRKEFYMTVLQEATVKLGFPYFFYANNNTL